MGIGKLLGSFAKAASKAGKSGAKGTGNLLGLRQKGASKINFKLSENPSPFQDGIGKLSHSKGKVNADTGVELSTSAKLGLTGTDLPHTPQTSRKRLRGNEPEAGTAHKKQKTHKQEGTVSTADSPSKPNGAASEGAAAATTPQETEAPLSFGKKAWNHLKENATGYMFAASMLPTVAPMLGLGGGEDTSNQQYSY